MPATLDLRAPSINIKFDKGKTLNPVFFYYNEDGTVVNLTGYTARMQARETIDAATTVLDLTTENGGLSIVNQTDPNTELLAYGVKLNVTATTTAAIAWTSAVFDIELITPSAVVLPLVKGNLIPTNEVTR